MIRITQLVHGKGTVSEALKHRKKQAGYWHLQKLADLWFSGTSRISAI